MTTTLSVYEYPVGRHCTCAVGAKRRTRAQLRPLALTLTSLILLFTPKFVVDVHAGNTLSYYSNGLTTNVVTPNPQASPAILAAVPTSNIVSVFPTGSNGTVPSLVGQTALTNPHGIAYFGGDIYVANTAANSITIYSASANGSPDPIDTKRSGH